MELLQQLRTILAQSVSELGVLLLALGWVILRVTEKIALRAEKSGCLKLKINGKEVIAIDATENKRNHIPREKEKIPVIEELGTQKTINRIS